MADETTVGVEVSTPTSRAAKSTTEREMRSSWRSRATISPPPSPGDLATGSERLATASGRGPALPSGRGATGGERENDGETYGSGGRSDGD